MNNNSINQQGGDGSSMQAAIGNGITQIQSGGTLSSTKTPEELGELRESIKKLKEIIESSSLSKTQKLNVNSELDSAIKIYEERGEESKIVGFLRKVAEIINNANATVESGGTLLSKAQPIFETLLKGFLFFH